MVMASHSRQEVEPACLNRQGLGRDAFHEVVSTLMQPFRLDTSQQNSFSLHAIQCSALSLVRIQARSGFTINTEPNANPYKLDLPIASGFRDPRTDDIFSPGRCGYLPRTGEPVKLDFAVGQRTVDVMCVIFRPEALIAYARQIEPDRMAIPLPDDQRLPMASRLGTRFQRYVQYIYEEILADASILNSSLVMAELQIALQAMFLELLPQQELPINTFSKVCDIATDKHVNSARAFIHAHLGEPLSIGQISAKIGVHPRTLHKRFRDHLNTTPMAYVKARRLEQVRQDLLAADPSRITIARAASRWGFNNLGHFAVDYRKAFGEPPSATLRRP